MKNLFIFLLILIILFSGVFLWYKRAASTQSFDTFVHQTPYTIQVYFPDRTKDPNREACTSVFPFTRVIDASRASLALNSMQALLQGPTPEEKAQGVYTSLPKGSELVYFDATGNKIDVYVDHDHTQMDECGTKLFEAQIKQTLFQFTSVDLVNVNPPEVVQ